MPDKDYNIIEENSEDTFKFTTSPYLISHEFIRRVDNFTK